VSDEIRRPGPVQEETLPREEVMKRLTGMPNQDGQEAEQQQEAPRRPGKVLEKTRPIPEQIDSAYNDITPGLGSNVDKDTLGGWNLLFWLLIATVLVWFLVDGGLFIYHIATISLWLSLLVTIPLLSLLAATGYTILREYRSWRSVSELELRKARLKRAVRDNLFYETKGLLQETIENLRASEPDLITNFEKAAADRDNAADYLRQFDNIVLTVLDKQADELILHAVKVAAAGTAISPLPALDALIVLWRAHLLICGMGRIYGLAPTGFTSLKILRHVVVSMAFAGGIQAFGKAVAADVTEKTMVNLLEPLAEGAATAIRIHRLGRSVQQYYRPWR